MGDRFLNQPMFMESRALHRLDSWRGPECAPNSRMSHASFMMYTVRRCGGLCVPSSARAGRNSVQLRASATSPSPLATVQLASSTLAQKLLADDTYHITFHGYLHNHVKHAIIALHGLQAPPEVIQRYWDMYVFSSMYMIAHCRGISPVVLCGGRNDQQSASCCVCLLYTSPSPRDRTRSRMPSSA